MGNKKPAAEAGAGFEVGRLCLRRASVDPNLVGIIIDDADGAVSHCASVSHAPPERTMAEFEPSKPFDSQFVHPIEVAVSASNQTNLSLVTVTVRHQK